MKIETPFHEGEIAVQKRVGVGDKARRNAAVITDEIVKGALEFIGRQDMVVAGSMDPSGNLWASVLSAQAGFMKAETGRRILFDLSKSIQHPHDRFWTNIEIHPRIGLLVIELPTRRRLRINGNLRKINADTLELNVLETYPNCPKYIQRRVTRARQPRKTAASAVFEGEKLKAVQTALIERADTFFVASAHPERGVDVSHRGGHPGFVQVLNEHTLRIPDYPGNSLFNTLGNFAVNPKAGLVFVDFEDGTTLQLSGQARILWDEEDEKNETGGTRRFWEMRIERVLEIQNAHPLSWEFLDYSPHNPKKKADRFRS
ncbi:MAG: pyridoxamine 5'-phosphate oxidase family protein, partial [Nitrospiria bacterium]